MALILKYMAQLPALSLTNKAADKSGAEKERYDVIFNLMRNHLRYVAVDTKTGS